MINYYKFSGDCESNSAYFTSTNILPSKVKRKAFDNIFSKTWENLFLSELIIKRYWSYGSYSNVKRRPFYYDYSCIKKMHSSIYYPRQKGSLINTNLPLRRSFISKISYILWIWSVINFKANETQRVISSLLVISYYIS